MSHNPLKILIVSFAFPPYNVIGAVRVGKTAKALLRLGHDVRVVSAADQPFPTGLALEIPAEKVTWTRWLDVHRPGRLFRPAPPPSPTLGQVAGTGRGGAWGAIRLAMARAYYTVAAFPDDAIGWLPCGIAAADRVAAAWKPDVIYASAVPFTSLLVAAAVARRRGVPWVAELRDLWTDSPDYWYPEPRRTAERIVETAVLNSASAVVTVSPPLAEQLRSRLKVPVGVVMNGYDPEDLAGPAQQNDGVLSIAYTGNLLTGRRGPDALFEAMRRLGDEVPVRVTFAGRSLRGVLDSARRHGVQARVEIAGAVPFLESVRLQKSSDVLLFLIWDEPGRCGIYSGKIFEYLGARRPILALGPDNDVGRDLITGRKAGVVLEDPGAVAGALRGWWEEKRRTGRVAPTPASAARGLTRMDQARLLAATLRDAARGRAR